MISTEECNIHHSRGKRGRLPAVPAAVVFRAIMSLACIPYLWLLVHLGTVMLINPVAIFMVLTGTIHGWLFVLIGLPSMVVAVGLIMRNPWLWLFAILNDVVILLFLVEWFCLSPGGFSDVVLFGLPFLIEGVCLSYLLYRHRCNPH